MHICLATQRWPVRRLSHENVGRKFAPGIIGIGMYIIGTGLLSPTVLPGSLTSPSQNKSSLPTITFQRQAVKLRGVSIGYHWGGLNHSDSRQGGKCVKADGPATMTFYQYSAQKKVRAKTSAMHAVRGGCWYGIMVVTNPLLRPAISLGETWHWGVGPLDSHDCWHGVKKVKVESSESTSFEFFFFCRDCVKGSMQRSLFPPPPPVYFRWWISGILDLPHLSRRM